MCLLSHPHSPTSFSSSPPIRFWHALREFFHHENSTHFIFIMSYPRLLFSFRRLFWPETTTMPPNLPPRSVTLYHHSSPPSLPLLATLKAGMADVCSVKGAGGPAAPACVWTRAWFMKYSGRVSLPGAGSQEGRRRSRRATLIFQTAISCLTNSPTWLGKKLLALPSKHQPRFPLRITLPLLSTLSLH